MHAAVQLIRQATSHTDRELVDEYLSTQSEATFSELVSRHSPMVRRVAADLVPDVADDIVQATFALFQRKIASVAGRESAAGWLCLTSRKLAMKARTSNVRRRIREEKSTKQQAISDPADELSLREVRSIVVQELNTLPDTLRIPLLVCYWDGDTQQEAARRLGCSLSTLKRRLDSARNKLAAKLKRKGFGPTVLFTTLSVLSATTVRSQAVTLSKSLSPLALQLLQTPGWMSVAGTLAATVMFIVSGAGLTLTVSAKAGPQVDVSEVQTTPSAPVPKQTEKKAQDSLGDTLPPGAVARFGTARLRPGMQTTALSFDPAGKSFFSYSHLYQNTSRFSIWDVGTGKELHRVDTPEIGLKSYRWTAAGRGVAVVQTGRDEHWLWNLTDPHATAPKQKDKLNTAEVNPGEILTVAISPDGKRVAAGRYHGQILRGPAGAGNPPPTVSFSVWDADASRPLQTQTPRWQHERKDDCIGLAFSPDGRELAGVFLENMPRTLTAAPKPDGLATVIRWDASNGQILGTFSIPNPMRKPHNGTRHTFNRQLPIAYVPKQQTLAIGADDGAVHLWDCADGRERKTIEFDKKGAIDWLEFHADGSRLAAVVGDGDWYSVSGTTSFSHAPLWSRLEIRDVSSGTVLNKWAVKLQIDASAVSPEGNTAAYVDSSLEIKLFETKSASQILNRFSLLNEATAMAIHRDGARAILAGRDGQFQTWDIKTGRLISTTPDAKPHSSLEVRSISADRKFAYGISNQTVSRIDIASGLETPLTKPITPPNYYNILGTNQDGTVAIAMMNNKGGTVQLITPVDHKTVTTIELPKRENEICNPHVALWSSDGKTVVLGGIFTIEWKPPQAQGGWEKLILDSRGWLATFDAKTGRPLALWMGKTFYPDRILPLNHSTAAIVVGRVDDDYVDGRLPVRKQGTRDYKQAIQVFDLATLKPVRPFEVAPGFNPTAGRGLENATISHDGKMLAVTGPLNDILVYETATGRIRKRFPGHAGGSIGLLEFDPAGRRLISAGVDRTALVWDVTQSEGPAPASATAAWKDLSQADAKKAYAAERFLLDHPAETMASFPSTLKPVPAVAMADVQVWIAALDANDYADRETATKQLMAHADQIRAELEEAANRGTSAEAKKRLSRILESSDESGVIEGTRLQQIRAVEILERMETPESIAKLKQLATGAPRSTMTRDALSAIARIRDRSISR
ncbi:MAG: sigma-70 family RNA polymerase sigma factor [Gemmataceae bacterium]